MMRFCFRKSRNLRSLTACCLILIVLGIDYTLDFGNGLYTALEAMQIQSGSSSASTESPTQWTAALTQNYPLDLLHHVGLIALWDLKQKTGKLLKIVEIREVFLAQERWYPRIIWFKDVLKKGEGTEIHIHDIEFDAQIQPSRFSKAALRR